MGNPAHVVFQQNGTAILLARVTAADATGAATGVSGEGKWLKQADVSEITCKVYNGNSLVQVASADPSISTSAILDVPVTDGVLWRANAAGEVDPGYNFYFVLPGTYLPTSTVHEVEVKITTTGGAVAYLQWEGNALKSRS